MIYWEISPNDDRVQLAKTTLTHARLATVRLVGAVWEIVFDRGPSHPGPYFATTVMRAKQQVYRYLSAHEDALVPRSERPMFTSGAMPQAPNLPVESAPTAPTSRVRRRPRRRR